MSDIFTQRITGPVCQHCGREGKLCHSGHEWTAYCDCGMLSRPFGTEREAVAEWKNMSTPLAPYPDPVIAGDLTPIMERLASIEVKIDKLVGKSTSEKE